MSEYKTSDIIKSYYDRLKGSDSYGKKDIKADVITFSKYFVGVGENRKKNKGVSIYYRIEECINIKPKDLWYAEIHTFNGDDAKEHMEWLKCLKDNRDIVGQFLFWIFYAITVGKKDGDTYDVNKDEVIGKLIKCCEDLEVTDEELEDVLCAVKFKMNCFLNQPEYHTELGKTFEILNPKENNQEKKDSTNQTPVDRKDELIRTFSNYMKAKYPMVLVDTIEDEEAVEIIKQASNDNGATVYQWNIVDGLVRDDGDGFVPTMQQASFEDFLNYLLSTVNGNEEKRVYIIRTVDEFLKKESMLGRIKLLSERIRKQTVGETIVFFVASNLELSPIIEKDIFLNTSIGYPDEKIINQIIEKVFEKEATDELVSKCKGLTRFEIERVLNLAKVKSEESTTETDKDALLKLVLKEKDQIIRKSGLVELVDTGDAIEPAGLKELMDWIDIKTKIFNNPVKAAENHVDLPRGVMLVGMPGCGKSSIAKATAKKFNVPLLKIDMGSLMNKYLGESEHNFKDALKLAEAMSPCVVWVDEMEKAFHSGDDKESSSDSAGRILAYLLTWMQERKSMTFVIATANEVKKLPPELLRKGRFDEVFFLDFPSEKERAEILKLHLDRRGISFSGISDVAYKTHNYSGAEIEYVVRDVTEKRFLNILDGKSERVTKKMFEEVIKNTTPLSETMKDELEELRDFCKKRKFRRANSEK